MQYTKFMKRSLSMNESYNDGGSLLQVYTLGRFEIYSGGSPITDGSKRSIRVWNLFKYILAHRRKMLSSGELIDAIWGEDPCENPEKALQNLIYRLRNHLSQNVKADELILFNQGCYKWNEKFPVWVDCDVLEEYSVKGKDFITSSPYDAKQCFEKVIEVYNGDFLSDILYDIWVLPVRTMYKKIYSDSMLAYLELLDKTGDYEYAVKVCSDFFKFEFFDEKVHLYFLKALISLNKNQEAQKHYDIVSEVMYRELGVSPSYTFAHVLRQAQAVPVKKEDKSIDLEFINGILWQDEKVLGAFFCDKDTFVSISKVLLRNLERSGLSIMLVLATFFEQPGFKGQDSRKNAPDIMEEARSMYARAFRRGDIICRWNPEQILIILTNLTFEDAHIAMNRINQKIKSDILGERHEVSYKVVPLSHEIL